VKLRLLGKVAWKVVPHLWNFS